MKPIHLSLAGSVLALACAIPGAFAADTPSSSMPKSSNAMNMSAPMVQIDSTTYSTRKTQAEEDYKSARSQCDSLASNAKDVCVAEAKSNRDKSIAQLDAARKPSPKAIEKMRISEAEADYDLAKTRCDSKTGNDKDVCVKQAKAQEVSAKADAKANRTSTDAHADAQDDKRDANYKLALQKCDGLGGAAKDQCVSNAKTTYGQ